MGRRPENSMDGGLGESDVGESHVYRKQTRFWGAQGARGATEQAPESPGGGGPLISQAQDFQNV